MLTFIFWFIIIVLIILGLVLGGGLMWLFGDIILLILSVCLIVKLFSRKKKDKE